MKVAVSNYPITYHHSWEAWENHVEKWVNEVKEADVLVFPEYGSMELASLLPKEVQQDAFEQVKQMQPFLEGFKQHYQKLAEQYQVIIVAPSFPMQMGEKIINRAWVFGPTGQLGYQDKLMMTPFETYDWKVSAGEPQLSVFETSKGNFGIQICYDAEFAIGAHILAKNGADILLVPSCTETLRGATRVHVGARARAMENQMYSIVSQTMGQATWTPTVDYNYGYCAAYSTPDLGFPELGILAVGKHQEPEWLLYNFDLGLLKQVREKGGVRNYKDGLNLDFQSKNGPISVVHYRLY